LRKPDIETPLLWPDTCPPFSTRRKMSPVLTAPTQWALCWAPVFLPFLLLASGLESSASCDLQAESDHRELSTIVVSLLQDHFQLASITRSAPQKKSAIYSTREDQLCSCAMNFADESCRGRGDAATNSSKFFLYKPKMRWPVQFDRLRTLGVAIAGFAVLRMDLTSVILLAI